MESNCISHIKPSWRDEDIFKKGRTILFISLFIVIASLVCAFPSYGAETAGQYFPAIAYDDVHNHYLMVFTKNDGSHTEELLPSVGGVIFLTEAVSQTVAQKLYSRILPAWSLFPKACLNPIKWFQLAFFCLLVVLLFQIILCYDGNFINDDPLFQVSQSTIILTSHYLEARLIKCLRETVYLSTMPQFDLFSRAPPRVVLTDLFLTVIRSGKEISQNR